MGIRQFKEMDILLKREPLPDAYPTADITKLPG